MDRAIPARAELEFSLTSVLEKLRTGGLRGKAVLRL
jgi:hypothetical protein